MVKLIKLGIYCQAFLYFFGKIKFMLFKPSGYILLLISCVFSSLYAQPQLNSANLKLPNNDIFKAKSIDLKPEQLATVKPTIDNYTKLERQYFPLAVAALKNGDLTTTKALLLPLLASEPVSMHALFLRAEVAKQENDLNTAIDLYRIMLEIDNSLGRPRLELAQALAQNGDVDGAKYHYNLALSNKLPNSLQDNIFKRLSKLNHRPYSLNFYTQILPSNNINNGSSNKSVTINGKRYVLSRDSQPKSGVGLVLGANAEVRFGGNYLNFIRANIQSIDFANTYYDEINSQISLGRSLIGGYEASGKYNLEASIGMEHKLYRQKRLYHGAKLNLSYQQKVSGNYSFAIDLDSQQLNYRQEYNYLNGWQHQISFNQKYIHKARTIYNFKIRYGLNKTDKKRYSYQIYGANLSLWHHFDLKQLSFGASLDYSLNKYKQADIFFDKIRRDHKTIFTISGLKRDWSYFGFAPRIGIEFVNNHSNLELYSYKSQQLTLTLSKEF